MNKEYPLQLDNNDIIHTQEPWGCLVYRVEININDQLIANPYHLYGQYLKDYNLDPKIKPCVSRRYQPCPSKMIVR